MFSVPLLFFTYHPQPNLRTNNYYIPLLELFHSLLRTLCLLLNCGTVYLQSLLLVQVKVLLSAP